MENPIKTTQNLEDLEQQEPKNNEQSNDLMLASTISPTDDDAQAQDAPTGWLKIREMYPEKHSNYTLTNKMYQYLLTLNNPALVDDVVSGGRVMIHSKLTGKYLYPNTKGLMNSSARGRKNGKLITTSLKKMLNSRIRSKNPLSGKLETMTVHEHLAAAAIAGAIKKGNFRHLNIVLERTEGKVVEEINQNITMGLGAVLKAISREDDDGTGEIGEEIDGEYDELDDEDSGASDDEEGGADEE